MEAKLVILSGKTNKRDVKLKLPTVIGRSRQADLTIAHPMISRRHCELFEADGFVKIRDLGSLNGTYVHGTRIAQEVLLRPNDEFTIGPLTFRIEYEAPETIPEPPPAPVEETPEYIPSFVQASEPTVPGPEVPDLTETSPEEPGPSESTASPPPLSEQPSPWEDIEAIEKEFDFDLAEEVALENPPETPQGPPPSAEPPLEQIAEEVLADQLLESEELAEGAPQSETASEPEEATPAETTPEPPPASPSSAPSTAVAEASPTPSATDEEEPDLPKPPATEAPPPSEEEGIEDLNEIEDAALRDFLKGLR